MFVMSDQSDHEFDFRGIWLTSRQAQRFVGCRSLKSWYEWRRRHGILPRNNGTVWKSDLDRELRRRKPRRVMHPNSLANLRKLAS